MFSFLHSKNDNTGPMKIDGNLHQTILTFNFQEKDIPSVLGTLPFRPKVALGFVSPSLNFSQVSSKLKQALAPQYDAYSLDNRG